MTQLATDTPEDPGSRSEVHRVLDASAVLAMLWGEPGAETVADAIADGAAMSAVNLAEAATVMTRDGDDLIALARVAEQVLIVPFGEEDAQPAAALIARDRSLSLGDRACLALAKRLTLPVITADSAWARLDLGVEIILIRGEEP